MSTDIINIALAFLEGFALIVSPCILPILPIILSGSLTGDKRRPIGIILGFILAFTIVTLFIRFLTQALHIDPEAIRIASLVLLLLLGILMMSTYLSEKFSYATQGLMNVGTKQDAFYNREGGLFGGIIFGMLVGVIWTPCAGPILAAVIVQVILQSTTLTSALSVIAFAVGAAIPMFVIALLGRNIMQQFTFFRNNAYAIRKILGAIIIMMVVLLYYNPTFGVSGEATVRSEELAATKLINPIPVPFPAPAISGIDAWINSPPLTIQQLRGKVVLIDFWTYSCINCIRGLPYLKDWYAKYHDKGFEIIGVHSPEFAFEHNLKNVQEAVTKFGIKYPVALDNKFVTWRNYFNRYWPAHYLINKNGDVVYIHFGEGEYDVTENNIRYLLGLNQMNAEQKQEKSNFLQTPETYLGYLRIENFASPESVAKNNIQMYTKPPALKLNEWALQGKWLIGAEKITSQQANAKIVLHFNAQHVYAVMGSTNQAIHLKINFHPLKSSPPQSEREIIVDKNQLYELLKFPNPTEGDLEITVIEPGLEMYTFTFG